MTEGAAAAAGTASGAPERRGGRFDAIVVGAGHNGLVSAAYLARAGLDVVVLERAPFIGGATLSEEAFPGFRYSVFSYLVSLLRPEVIHELGLVRHGLFLVPTASTLNPLPGGDCLFREADPQRTYHHIARHSRRDAEALSEYKLEMRRLGHLMFRLQRAAPDELAAAISARVEEAPEQTRAEVSAEVAEIARYFLDLPKERMRLFLQMLTMSSADFLDRWFECDALKAALSSSSIIGSFLSPRTPGSAYVLLHHYMGEVDGVYREWGFQKGGTGGIAAVIASAARGHGAEIRTDCPVARVLARDGRARGVVLANGDELTADVVVSSAAPQISLGSLLDAGDIPGGDASDGTGEALLRRAARWQSSGCAGKVNLALDGLPRFECMPEPGPYLAGGITIAPSLDYVDRAFDDAKYGSFSERPFIDMIVPSVLDPDMAPPGKCVLSCFVQYAPCELAGTTWDEQRDAFGDAVVGTLAEYAPGIEDQVLHRQVRVPPDIESIAGIPGGNIFHGELRLSQLFLLRPDPAAAAFRTPLPGYYLCGSSTQFGGGISGGPGRLAALRVLDDLKRRGAEAP